MSARNRTTNSTKQATTNSSFLSWIAIIGIALFLLISPYNRGLFNGYEFSFDSPIYVALIFGFILLLVTAIYLVRNWKLDGYRSLLSIAALLLPFIYWISSFQAVSSYYATFMTFVMFFLASLFLAGLYFAENLRSRKIIEYALMLTSYIIVLFGLLNLFGQIFYKDALWLAHDGYRLTAVFQYSNTYAGFLVALLLVSIYYAAHCIRWQARLLHAFMLVPIWFSFMLTYSRGAIVIIPVMVLIIIPFLRFHRQITYMIYLALSALVSIVILGKLTSNADAIAKLVQPTPDKAVHTISLFSSLPIQSWGLLLIGSLVVSGFILLFESKATRWLEVKTTKLASFKWSFAAVPILILGLVTIAAVSLISSSTVRALLPDKVAVRFENINLQQHSVLERITFYKDGLRLAEDYPLIGGGGGAWQVLYEQYQNNPYWSRQAHSFFIQVLVESGWIGLGALVGFLAFVYWLYIRCFIRYPQLRGSHFIFFIFSLSLLIHSVIDFDMSFIFISSILFLSLGCMIAPFGRKLLIERFDKLSLRSWQRLLYPSMLVAVAAILLINSMVKQNAIQTYNKAIDLAMQPQTSLSEVLPIINSAIKKSPNQSIFSLTKADWLEQGYSQTKNRELLTETLALLEKAKEQDVYNRQIILSQYKLLQMDGQFAAALQILDEGITKFPWDINFYEQAITSYVEAHATALSEQDSVRAQNYEDRINELYGEVIRRSNQLKELPTEQQQGRSFGLTTSIEEAIAIITND